jgi:mRNA interferase RelE/StbE
MRIGDYRVVYSIDDTQKTVEVLRIRHRKDVYKI